MTNWERWQLRLREVTSPQSFIDFGFVYLVSSYLQRRVWTNADHQKLFPNVYIILVGDPGIGKGLVIKPVTEFLKEHKLDTIANKSGEQIAKMSDDQVKQLSVEASDFAEAVNKNQKPAFEKPKYKIPIGPDSTTFEAVVETMAKQPRRITFYRWDEKAGKRISDIYRHNSLAFSLEEISTLFTKDKQTTSKTINFLLKAYDCGDVEYITKTSGEYYIKGCCMNLLGGTTPKFMEDAFNEGILGDGFAARTWFIHASANRFYKLRTPQLDAQQVQASKELSEHLLKLTKLYGYIPFSPEADAWLTNWWEKEQLAADYKRPNMSDKLNSYYGRKNIHIQKLATILHFSEDAETMDDGHTPKNPISLETTKRAMNMLNSAETTMHLALSFSGINPLHKLSQLVMRYLKKKGAASTDLLITEFFADIPGTDPQTGMNQTIDYLRMSKQIELDEKTGFWLPRG